jgi:glycosidase
MVWDDMNYDKEINHPFGQRREADDQNFDHELHSFFMKLGQIRKDEDVLRTGDYVQLHADRRNQTFAFGRYNENEWIIALFNRSEEEQSVTITLPEWFSPKEELRDLISGESFQTNGNRITISTGSVSAMILK